MVNLVLTCNTHLQYDALMSEVQITWEYPVAITEREALAELGYCPDCYELAHDGACVSGEEAEDEY